MSGARHHTGTMKRRCCRVRDRYSAGPAFLLSVVAWVRARATESARHMRVTSSLPCRPIRFRPTSRNTVALHLWRRATRRTSPQIAAESTVNGHNASAMSRCENARQLRTKEEDLRRVIHPDEQGEDTGRRAIHRTARLPHQRRHEQTADVEEECCRDGAHPRVTPRHVRVWQCFVDEGEHPSHHEETDGEIEQL